MPLLSHSLQRLSEKVVSLGFPQSHFFDAGFDFTYSSGTTSSSCAPPSLLSADHLALTVLYGQSFATLAFLEANAIRSLPSEADRRAAFGGGVRAEAFVSSVLLPYYERVTSSSAILLSGLLPPSRVLAATAVGLSAASGGNSLPTSAEDCEVAALSVVRALTILADVAIGLVAAEDTIVAEGATGLSTPVPAAARLVSSTSVSSSSSAAVVPSATGERISGGAPAAPVTPAEQRALEAAMIRLIGLFGLTAPPNTSNTSASSATNNTCSGADVNGGAAKKSSVASAASPYDLKGLTRMAARCVFLAQRIVLAPSDFGLSDAFEMLAAVPLFGGGSSSASSSATASAANPLDQYTQALRLLLTLESELLQRFVTIVVDEAQSFTAQCAFDPSGHRVGI